MKLNRWLLLIWMLLPLTVMASQTVLVFGDSLSAAYGIPRETGWVYLLEQRLLAESPGARVVNASISGETTSGGLGRIKQALAQHKPTLVIIELGANDGLRGLPVKESTQNLKAIIEACKLARAKILLVGMKIPPNYGIRYAKDFSDIFPALASHYKTGLVPFLLEGVAGNPALIQTDGLHPVAEAQPRLLQNVWPEVRRLVIR